MFSWFQIKIVQRHTSGETLLSKSLEHARVQSNEAVVTAYFDQDRETKDNFITSQKAYFQSCSREKYKFPKVLIN